MGQSEAAARSSVRFSFGRQTTADEIDRAVALVGQAVLRLREARS
jgi:cysteine sulfinate desulfinase/cysteine desulfurase-like protein